MISGNDFHVVQQEVLAQKQAWDKMWAKQMANEARQQSLEERNRMAQIELQTIDRIITDYLLIEKPIFQPVFGFLDKLSLTRHDIYKKLVRRKIN